MTDIATNITLLKGQIPSSVKLVVVSKTMPVEDILKAYNAGQRIFGENRVQELQNKKALLPGDIEWHFIGHLQSKKVKHVIPITSMVQSVDSIKLLKIINDEALKILKVVDCLLQIHIASEETKYGFNMKEIEEALESKEYMLMKNIRICGVMGMATYTTDKNQISKEFSYLSDCFNNLKDRWFEGINHFSEVSMGMSGDYDIAIEKGSTMVRIGSLIFGDRNNV